MTPSIEHRIAALESDVQRLRRQVTRVHVGWTALVSLIAVAGAAAPTNRHAMFEDIQAREITVIDHAGHVRARVGGDLPEDTAGGRTHHRPATAGFLIYDEEGIERGGYVTQGPDSNAMLTLDSKHGQSAMFVAGASADLTTALELWTPTSRLALRADSAGARLSVSDESGVVFQSPEIKLSPSICASQHALARQYPGEHVCRERFTEAACQACLGEEPH